ncbi:MAG: 3-oxoacyl-ACP synthase [Capnocytophaga sp.]|nr:3-oxoacyl-ACP synthase [Capnocytophaga sp.]
MKMNSHITSFVSIEKNTLSLNGNSVFQTENISFDEFIKKAYRYLEISYPKFFKMDRLSKLAFVASELIFKGMSQEEKDGTALVFANSSASMDTDLRHQESISAEDNFYPSPAVFVYTLPNICLGEISIRHQLLTENSFFVFSEFPNEFFKNYANTLLQSGKAKKVLCGWVELLGENYRAELQLVENR